MATIGIDIAASEGKSANWQSAKSLGHLRFVGLRCAYGTTPDAGYRAYASELDAARVPHFPYLFLRWGIDTPQAQAHAALDAAYGGALPNWHGFPLCVDVEGDRNGLTLGVAYDWLLAACDTIRSSIGVEPMLYTSAVYWQDPAGMHGLPAPELANCLGWWKYWPFPVEAPAVYDPAVVDELAPPAVPTPWGSQWVVQQYQGDARGYPGLVSTCDMDRINVVRQGATGDSVKAIQRRVGATADGIFGPRTLAAVQAFQFSRGLAVDGVVGLDTWQALAWVKL
jgi:hypothetical protein